MELQAFQPWERRDENDNIIRAGSYGKKSALTNAQNTGILDYIGNNLDVLNAGFTELADDVYRKADVYTKTEINTALADKVSKSGDTVSGSLKFNTNTCITKNDNTREMQLCGGENIYDGGAIILYGKTFNGDEGGAFRLRAGKSSEEKIDLIGKPSGSLTWNGKHITLDGDCVKKSGDILNGTLSFSTNTMLKKTSNSSLSIITGGDAEYKGGQIKLWGYEVSDGNNGRVLLEACNGTQSQSAQINLYPNGKTDCPTPATNDNSSRIATTAFVNSFINTKLSAVNLFVPDNVSGFEADRCIWVKNGNIITIWFALIVNQSPNIRIIEDFNNKIGYRAKDAFGMCFAGANVYGRIVCINNGLQIEALEGTINAGTKLFGYISVGVV